MSGASVPYHLRPHKAVDRRLFVDLLSRYERWKPLADYAYISMGAYPLEDHKLVHRIFGTKKLIAFDFDEDIVARQEFNKPIEACRCLKKKSGELIAQLDTILADCGFSAEGGVVIWLDYTDPKKIGEQIREFESLLDKLRCGDVVRVTVNAHPHAVLDAVAGPDGKPLLADERKARQFKKLKDRIGDFLPSWATPDHMTPSDLPLVLSESFGTAAVRALPVSGASVFAPLSIIRYADGVQMLSITGTVLERGKEQELVDRIALNRWPFASMNWKTIHRLVVPHLTVRERLFLERGVVTKSPDELMQELGFKIATQVEIKEFLENYRNYYRFYPTLLPAEI